MSAEREKLVRAVEEAKVWTATRYVYVCDTTVQREDGTWDGQRFMPDGAK